MNNDQLSNASIETLQQENLILVKKKDQSTQTDPISFTQIKKINFGQLMIFLIILIFCFVVYVDIQGKLNIQQQQIELKQKQCVLDYEKQKCYLQLPAQKQYCLQLEQCININWELQRGIELSSLIADMINNFSEKIYIRTYLMMIIPFTIICIAIIKYMFN